MALEQRACHVHDQYGVMAAIHTLVIQTCRSTPHPNICATTYQYRNTGVYVCTLACTMEPLYYGHLGDWALLS